jgi:hypothetical protein
VVVVVLRFKSRFRMELRQARAHMTLLKPLGGGLIGGQQAFMNTHHTKVSMPCHGSRVDQSYEFDVNVSRTTNSQTGNREIKHAVAEAFRGPPEHLTSPKQQRTRIVIHFAVIRDGIKQWPRDQWFDAHYFKIHWT